MSTIQIENALSNLRRDFQRVRKLLETGRRINLIVQSNPERLTEERKAEIVLLLKSGTEDSHYKLKQILKELTL